MKLAIDGGTPVRSTLLPYSRQSISDEDIAAVTDVLRSDWLTTGPAVGEFERAFADFVGTKHAIAVSNGTAALHAAMNAIKIGKGDEVIVPTMTFSATANAAVFCGGTPVFVDCNHETLLIDPEKAEEAITEKTKAICAVDYAGQPCDYDILHTIAENHNITLIDDACHALGGSFRGRNVGSLADLNTFSFHPVKPLTTGEGGMITTDDADCAHTMRQFRNHCLTSDHRERHEQDSWLYDMVDLGWNYRLTDFQCALGLSQLQEVASRTQRRQEIAKKYDAAFASLDAVNPLKVHSDVSHAYHLYVVRFSLEALGVDRAQMFRALRSEGIGVNVHYIPVHLHPFYRKRFHTAEGLCPIAESAYESILSLPIFAGMNEQDISDVIEAVTKVCNAYQTAATAGNKKRPLKKEKGKKKKRVLVTGASGLLGGNLLHAFPDTWEIIGVVNQHSIVSPGDHVHIERADLLKENFTEIMKSYEPLDVIVHTAALTNVDLCEEQQDLTWKLNALLPGIIAQHCADKGIHLVHISTDHIFDGKDGMYSEKSVPHPINYYAKAKYEAEKLVLDAQCHSTIIRTNFFGFNVQEKNDFAGWVRKALNEHMQLPLFTDIYFSPILTNQLAACIVEVIERDITGVLHIASANGCSKYEFGLMLAKAFDLPTETITPLSIESSHLEVSRPKNMTLNTEQAQKILKTPIPTVDESIALYKKLLDTRYPLSLKPLAIS
jgi:perosamine synthetase